MNLLAIYGLLGHGLLCGALVSRLPLGHLRQRAALIATTIALLAGIAPLLHAWFGPPSVTLLMLALLQLPTTPLTPLTASSARYLLGAAVLFYVAGALPGEFAPYALGYQPGLLLALLGGLTLWLWGRRQTPWLLILAADLGVWLTGIFANLWDVLFDPLLILLCAAIVGQQQVARWLSARRR